MKKKNREQIVPLSTQAAELFERALKTSMDGHVFPAYTDSTARLPHINGESVSRAMARLCERIKLKDAHTHDLRKCITTWLREHKHVSVGRAGFDPSSLAKRCQRDPLRFLHARRTRAPRTSGLG